MCGGWRWKVPPSHWMTMMMRESIIDMTKMMMVMTTASRWRCYNSHTQRGMNEWKRNSLMMKMKSVTQSLDDVDDWREHHWHDLDDDGHDDNIKMKVLQHSNTRTEWTSEKGTHDDEGEKSKTNEMRSTNTICIIHSMSRVRKYMIHHVDVCGSDIHHVNAPLRTATCVSMNATYRSEVDRGVGQFFWWCIMHQGPNTHHHITLVVRNRCLGRSVASCTQQSSMNVMCFHAHMRGWQWKWRDTWWQGREWMHNDGRYLQLIYEDHWRRSPSMRLVMRMNGGWVARRRLLSWTLSSPKQIQ